MITYPLPASTMLANATVAQSLAFLKSPNQIARRFAEILADHNFLSHAILRGRYDIVGGVVVLPPEIMTTSEGPETVAPGGEYPLITLNPDAPAVLAAGKKGFGTEITDEQVGRYRMNVVEEGIQSMAFSMVMSFDGLTMSAIQSAVTATLAGGLWTGASAAATIIANVEAAKASLRAKKKGYRATTVVLTGTQYAAVAPALVPLLPREAGNPILSGAWPNILGLDWVTSDDLPAGWTPTVVDADRLGGIGHEDIPSPEYVSVASIAAANGSNVEVARFREKNDSTRIQVRKADVPVIRNADAGIEITGTGL